MSELAPRWTVLHNELVRTIAKIGWSHYADDLKSDEMPLKTMELVSRKIERRAGLRHSVIMDLWSEYWLPKWEVEELVARLQNCYPGVRIARPLQATGVVPSPYRLR